MILEINGQRPKRTEQRQSLRKEGGGGMWGALAQGINNTTHGLIWDNVSSDRAMNDWRDMSYQNMINTNIQGVINNAKGIVTGKQIGRAHV